jgi:hypothetical protein
LQRRATPLTFENPGNIGAHKKCILDLLKKANNKYRQKPTRGVTKNDKIDDNQHDIVDENDNNSRNHDEASDNNKENDLPFDVYIKKEPIDHYDTDDDNDTTNEKIDVESN